MIDKAYRNIALQHGILLEREEKEKVVHDAKAGSKEARERLVLSLFRFCEDVAYQYSSKYQEDTRIEHADLAQIAVLTILECMDRALAQCSNAKSVYAYLAKAVYYEIAEHCAFRRGLIRIPGTHTREGRAIYSHYFVQEIDDYLQETLTENRQQSEERNYTRLYQAIDRLKGRHRDAIILRYGLYEHEPLSFEHMSLVLSNGKSKTMGGNYHKWAIEKLRKMLAPWSHS